MAVLCSWWLVKWLTLDGGAVCFWRHADFCATGTMCVVCRDFQPPSQPTKTYKVQPSKDFIYIFLLSFFCMLSSIMWLYILLKSRPLNSPGGFSHWLLQCPLLWCGVQKHGRLYCLPNLHSADRYRELWLHALYGLPQWEPLWQQRISIRCTGVCWPDFPVSIFLFHVKNFDVANTDQQWLSAVCAHELLPGFHVGFLQ